MIDDNNYIHIEGWMINKLELKGNDLLVYAIIYGFSQDGNSRFTGSMQYLADWCNSTKQGIQKNLKSLIDKGFIQKFETLKNNIKYCEYSCIPYNKVVCPIQQSCTNNTSNILNKTNTKVLVEKSASKRSSLITVRSDVNNSVNTETSTNKKTANMYAKCLDMINKFTDDPTTVQLLKKYLDMRLAMKDKPMYANQWQGLLNKLDKLDSTEDGIQRIIKQSIELGYASFFPYNPNIGKGGSKQDWHNDVAHRNVKSVSMTGREREEFEKEVERRELTGERVTF